MGYKAKRDTKGDFRGVFSVSRAGAFVAGFGRYFREVLAWRASCQRRGDFG